MKMGALWESGTRDIRAACEARQEDQELRVFLTRLGEPELVLVYAGRGAHFCRSSYRGREMLIFYENTWPELRLAVRPFLRLSDGRCELIFTEIVWSSPNTEFRAPVHLSDDQSWEARSLLATYDALLQGARRDALHAAHPLDCPSSSARGFPGMVVQYPASTAACFMAHKTRL